MKHVLDFPVNTLRLYVRARTYNGCEVYFPVDSRDNAVVQARKNEVQQYFNSLAPSNVPPPPRYA